VGKQVRRRFSERQIATWRRSAKPGDKLNDGGGLHLMRQSVDAKGKGRDYWVLRYVSPETGKRGWAALWPGTAPYPQASTEEARQRAEQARIELARRVDPFAARQRKEAADKLNSERRLTVRQVFERWASTELSPHIRADGRRIGRKDGGAYARAQFDRRVFPTLGETPITEVRKADLLAILDGVKGEGKLRTCNVLLADLKQMLRFAVAREIIPHSPLEAVTKRHAGGADAERERVLSVAEVQTLAKALPDARMHRRSELAVWLILATGCRIGELMGAQWEHVDTNARTWHLPVTKNERPHTIHLSDFAVRKFQALHGLREMYTNERGEPVASPWVFPGTDGAGPVDAKTLGKQVADRQRPAGQRGTHRSKATASLSLPGGKWTAHDLRRTAATLMASLGVSGDVIDECLNHVIESRVRRTYIRDRRPAQQAAAFDALGVRLAGLIEGRAQRSNVIELPERAAA